MKKVPFIDKDRAEEIAASTRFVVKVLPEAIVTPAEPSSLGLPQMMLFTARPPAMRRPALPTVDNLVVLAALFGVTIDEILIFQESGRIRISA